MRGVERILYSLAAFVIVIAGIRAAASFIVPFLLAVFITIIVTPFYLAMRHRGLSNVTALLILLLILGAAGFGTVNIVGRSIRDFTRKLPEYQINLMEQRARLFEWLESKGIDPVEFRLDELVDPRYLLRYAGSMVSALSSLIGQGFLVFLISMFMLLELSILPSKLALIPYFQENSHTSISNVFQNIRYYIGIKTVMSILTGICIGLWCWILGLDQIILLGLLAFILNYIPTIGSIIAALPALLIALTTYGLGRTIICAIGYFLINTFISNVIEPRWTGRSLGLSPLVVLVSVFFWGWALGPAGMFFSVPLTMVIKIILEADPTFRWFSVLLGSSPTVGKELDKVK